MSLLDNYKEWCNVPENATRDWYQKRGYALEKIIYEAMKRDGLNPRSSYKIEGEQIDGSFILGDRVYLLEAKWHKKEMSASNMYEFKGKVDGKLTGTIGIFISISGYSKDSITALIYGKEINVILFDRHDFELALEKEGEFKRILIEKLRTAAEVGTPMYSVNAIEQEAKEKDSEPQDLGAREATSTENEVEEFTIICEGSMDKIILNVLASRITDKRVTVIEAIGARNIPLVANKVLTYKRNNNKLLLVTDSDGNEVRVLNMFKELIWNNDWEGIIINDSIEDWISYNKESRKLGKLKIMKELEEKAQEINIAELRKKVQSFDKFCTILEN